MSPHTLTAAAAIGVALTMPGCSDSPEPTNRTPIAAREVVVATTMTAAGFVDERVCLDQGGLHVLEVEAASENWAVDGFLTIDDGTADGEYVTSAMRTRGQPRRVRSDPAALYAGEPCYLLSAQTFARGERATTRLIRLEVSRPRPAPSAPLTDSVQESGSGVDPDEPLEFSAHTKQLLTLYEELRSFKDDPSFHEVGFGRCCRFHDWKTCAATCFTASTIPSGSTTSRLSA